MESFSFPALGTKWSVSVDHDVFTDEQKKAILDEVVSFENRFSRFLPASEVNRFREATPGVYEISKPFSVMLFRADRLRHLSGGLYDPAVGGLLERAGYGIAPPPGVSLAPENFSLPQWSLTRTTLTLDGPVAFDLGGIGKGYCIDLVGSVLERLGFRYFLVEGGGDMYGTSKRDGSPYRIALEYPGRPDTAFGTLELKYQAVAVSDTFKRRWQKWHHIVNPQSKKPIAAVVGAAALAGSAFDADSMTSGLFLSPFEAYPLLSEEWGAEYVVFREDGLATVSPGWPGELFLDAS